MGTNYYDTAGQHIGKSSRIHGQTVFTWAVDPVRFTLTLADQMETHRAMGRPDDAIARDEYGLLYSAFELRDFLASVEMAHDYTHIGEEFS